MERFSPSLSRCCADPEKRTSPEPVDGKPGLTVAVCRECGAKHYELDADAALLNMRVF